MNPDIERGTNFQYKNGYPDVRLIAMGSLDNQNDPQLQIIADIIYGSLMFKRHENKRIADLSIELRILDLDNDEHIVHSKRFSYDQSTEDYQLTKSQDKFTLQREIGIDPGNYRVMLTLIDQNTDKRSTRISTANVPDPTTDNSTLTNIRMLGKEVEKQKNEWNPITTYDVPGKLDSVKFNYQVLKRSDQNLVLDSKLIKFKTDTSYAKPMNRAFVNTPALFDEGINYDKREVIQSNKRVLAQNGVISIEYNFPKLPQGNYRFIVVAKEGHRELYKARDFSIKSDNYPTLKSAQELASPLIYLMNRKEYSDLMAIEDQDSLKSQVDRFWLRELGNKSKARAVIELYYERVEEANKHFSNFKEGWKTDRGMVYILFGPPWYQEEYHQGVRWSYTYDMSDSDMNFNFLQVKVQSEYFPFEHYVLDREQSYYTILNRQKQLWLSGRILERKI